MWMLILNAAALAGLLVTLWRLRRLQSFVTWCVRAKTIQDGHGWISFEQYLARRFNIHVSQGLSREEAAKLKAYLASLPAEEHATDRLLGRHRLVLVEHRDRPPVSPRSALDEFPEENSLVEREASHRVPADTPHLERRRYGTP
jgi:hypothetical protein